MIPVFCYGFSAPISAKLCHGHYRPSDVHASNSSSSQVQSLKTRVHIWTAQLP